MKFIRPVLFLSLLLVMSCSSDHDPVDVFNRGDYETAYKLWQPLASRGDLDALNYLGIHYYIGLGVNRDYRKAAGYFRKAAEAGHPDAQYNLGIMYENGQYVSQDFTTAYVWLYAAHMQGNPHAQEHMKRLSGEHKLLPNQITHAQKLSLPYIK